MSTFLIFKKSINNILWSYVLIIVNYYNIIMFIIQYYVIGLLNNIFEEVLLEQTIGRFIYFLDVFLFFYWHCIVYH